MWYSVLMAILVAYLLGNLNGAVCVSALLHDDVRSHGSGNAGLTNFIRNYGAGRSVMVIVIDAGKAVFACLAAGLIMEPHGYGAEGAAMGALAVMLGHDFPVMLGFRGGKGILSGWFIAWTLDWRIGLLIGMVFFTAYLLTRYVSLGSVLAALAFGVGFVIFQHDNIFVMTCGIIMSLLTVFMHRGNIKRLLNGTETKTNLFGKGKKQ